MRDQLIVISSNAKFLFRDEQVIIFNRTNRQWLKLSKQCYEIIMNYNNHTVDELMNDLVDDEDRDYMKKVLDALNSMNLLHVQETKRKLHDVSFAVSNRCNLKCKHCMVSADSCSKEENFSTKQIKESFDKIIKADPELITVTVGEPLVRTDFAEIITYLREHYDGKIGLMTNATLINKSNVDVIVNSVDNISISLDGATPKTVELIRGKGVYEKVLESIKLLQDKHFEDISVSMVVTADNEFYIDEFISLCKGMNCEPILRVLSIAGEAANNKELLSKQQLSTENRSNIGTEKKSSSEEYRFYTCSCDAGATTLKIENDGNIYPCNLFVESEYCLGNILDVDELTGLLQKHPHKFLSECLLEYEPEQIRECKGCDLAYFCWSCLHEVLELRNTRGVAHKCKYAKKYYNNVWSKGE